VVWKSNSNAYKVMVYKVLLILAFTGSKQVVKGRLKKMDIIAHSKLGSNNLWHNGLSQVEFE
jgi:hypothetical protein